MEINRSIFKKLIIVITLFFVSGTILGCGKKFWDYECVWVSDSPYIYMPTHSTPAVIEINGERKDVDASCKPSGLAIIFRDPDIDNGETEESIIWETNLK